MFLKSTDDSMIETLEKMSGKTHRVRRNQKSVTRDQQKQWQQVDSKVTYTMSTSEEPVISFNDMAFISERNSIVFRAGDSPIWNRNQMALPMSWRLFKDTIVDPGQEYTLQSIPTLSTALDFDVRKNQPNFFDMLEWRVYQACAVEEADQIYRKRMGYSDYDISQLDPDTYSADMMRIINSIAAKYKALDDEVTEARRKAEAAEARKEAAKQQQSDLQNSKEAQDSYAAAAQEMAAENEDYEPSGGSFDYVDNTSMQEELAAQKKAEEDRQIKRYARGNISRADLTGAGGIANEQLGNLFRTVFQKHPQAFADLAGADCFEFSRDGNKLHGVGANASTVYIVRNGEDRDVARMNEAAKRPDERAYADTDDVSEAISTFDIKPAFYLKLAEMDSWKDLGRFDADVAAEFKAYEDQSMS